MSMSAIVAIVILRLMAHTRARWDAQEQERLAAALQSPLGQRYLWGDAG